MKMKTAFEETQHLEQIRPVVRTGQHLPVDRKEARKEEAERESEKQKKKDEKD
jgi:hypothetical protein